MDKEQILNWIKTEFLPVTLVTADEAIFQLVDNAVRYMNTYSAIKTVEMVSASTGTSKIQISTSMKNVIKVTPASPSDNILMNYPMWSLLGVAILDNVTNDMITMSEAFKNYKYYIGSDFRWQFLPSLDSSEGGYLYTTNIPENTTKLAIIGTKRLVADADEDYDIKDEYMLNWVLRYTKALVKQVEGNALRKSNVLNIKNDGQELYGEGKDEIEDLKKELMDSGKWTAFVRRF